MIESSVRAVYTWDVLTLAAKKKQKIWKGKNNESKKDK